MATDVITWQNPVNVVEVMRALEIERELDRPRELDRERELEPTPDPMKESAPRSFRSHPFDLAT